MMVPLELEFLLAFYRAFYWLFWLIAALVGVALLYSFIVAGRQVVKENGLATGLVRMSLLVAILAGLALLAIRIFI